MRILDFHSGEFQGGENSLTMLVDHGAIVGAEQITERRDEPARGIEGEIDPARRELGEEGASAKVRAIPHRDFLELALIGGPLLFGVLNIFVTPPTAPGATFS
jgi:hypothetical protein